MQTTTTLSQNPFGQLGVKRGATKTSFPETGQTEISAIDLKTIRTYITQLRRIERAIQKANKETAHALNKDIDNLQIQTYWQQ